MNETNHRRFYVAMFVSGVVFVTAITAIIVAIYLRHEGDIRDIQTRVDARLVACQEIEKLKTQRRLDAWRSWNTLPLTLKLLHVDRTPAVVQLSRKSRDRVLRAFAPINCHAFATSGNRIVIPAPSGEEHTGLLPGQH